MASRSKYTYTPTYSRQPAKPRTQPAPRRTTPARPPAARKSTTVNHARPQKRKASPAPQLAGDTIVLLLLFLVVPVAGLFALFFQPMRWVFCMIALLAMLSMWSLGCFLPRSRAFLSGVLSVLMIISLVAAIPSAPEENVFPQFGMTNGDGQNTFAYNPTNDPSLVGLVNPSATPDVSAQPADTVLAENAHVKTAAEETLEAYLKFWQMGNNWNDMVQYTTPEWRESIQSPVQQLFYNHKTKILVSWTIAPPVIADTDTAATIEVEAIIQLPVGDQKKTRFSALMQLVDGTWFVDPSSLASGIDIQEPTPTPDPNAVATPSPTPTINPSMKLYYNKDGGGSMYHTKADCESINEKYWEKMVSFKYSQLDEKAYSKLNPCAVCGAPARPEE